MAFSAMMPLVVAIEEPIGKITNSGSGQGQPVEIWAMWCEVIDPNPEGTDPIDDEILVPGCQIDPPLAHHGTVHIRFYTAVYDPDHDQQQIKFDLFEPDNPDGTCYQPGDGNIVPERDVVEYDCGVETVLYTIQDGDNIETPQHSNAMSEYLHYEYIYDNYHIPGNQPFICYKNDKAHVDIEREFNQNKVWFKWVDYELYYHDMAGWYNISATVLDEDGFSDTQSMFFEYVPTLKVEFDFDLVDWGEQTLLHTWFDNWYDGIPTGLGGDWIFCTDSDYGYSPVPPTMRNIGNWYTEVQANFSSDIINGFENGKAFFDIRVGDNHPEAQKYNLSYAQKYTDADETTSEPGIVQTTDEHDSCGLKLDTLSKAFPMDNPGLNVDDVLMICHTVKLNFYIYVIQWNLQDPGITYDVPIVFETGLNSNLDPCHIWPAERDPCTGELPVL